MARNHKLNDAISTLASLYEYGELQADTDPVGFIETVIDDVQKLRAENARLRRAMLDAADMATIHSVNIRDFLVAALGPEQPGTIDACQSKAT